MKRFFTLFVVLIVFNSWFNAPTAQAQGAPDQTLAAAVRRYLELRPTDSIKWKTLKEFSDSSGSIKSLKGLELATNLERLELHKSPIDDLTPLANLKKLREIDLFDDKISDLTPLAGLTQLEFLRFLPVYNLQARNKISDLTPLAGLTQLEFLTIWNNEISDLTPLTGLTKLEHLGLSQTQISDIAPLTQLTRLRGLVLGGNKISDITPLAGLTKLRVLDITRNKISDITPLAGLTGLESVILGGNGISDITPLTRLTKLQVLSLYSNQINDIKPLAGLTALEGLDLGNNQINDIKPLAGLTLLRGLALGTNRIKDLSPLAGLRYLQALFLARNQISNITPLTGLTELEVLDLGENPITDAGRLKTLPKLTQLRLGGNPSDYYTFLVILVSTDRFHFRIPSGVRSATAPKPETPPQETPPQETPPQSLVSTSVNEADLPPIYWVDSESNTLYRLTDGEVRPLLPNVQNATSLAIDVANDKLYWTEQTSNKTGKIRCANLDGTHPQLVKNLTSVPHDIALDTTGGKIYLTNSWGKVQRLNVDGSDFQPNLITGLDTPKRLVLDVLSSKVYWTEKSGRIRRANLDGSNIQDVVTGLATPMDITLFRNKIYWAEKTGENQGEIRHATLNGNPNPVTYTTFTQGFPVGIAVNAMENKLYWTTSLGEIGRANIDGSNFQPNAVTGLGTPGSLDIESRLQEVLATNAVLSISPSSVTSPAIGEQLSLNLKIAAGEAVAGYRITVRFDETALRYVESSKGNYLPAGATFATPVVKGGQVVLTSNASTGVSNGDGTLATITFEVLAVKASTLTLFEPLLTDNQGNIFLPRIEAGEVTEPPKLKEDVTGDGLVNILDLVSVASNFGETGQNPADVNDDGIVNISDLVLVAGAFNTDAVAPSLDPGSLELLTPADVREWLSQAHQLNSVSSTYQQGVLVLEQLLAALPPKETLLLPNYPNPFNPETWIPYQLAKAGDVKISIYDAKGVIVRTLVLEHQSPGFYASKSRAAYWDGRNTLGERVASGLYFYQLQTDDVSLLRKMIILK